MNATFSFNNRKLNKMRYLRRRQQANRKERRKKVVGVA